MLDVLKNYGSMLLTLVAGALAVLALLPRPGKRGATTLLGAALMTLAIVMAVVTITGSTATRSPSGIPATIELLLFYGFSFIAVVAGILMLTQTQPARAALSFTLVVLATCGLFLLLAAPFLFAATIIVYAGAIIVMFLFVLMLSQQSGVDDADVRSREPLLSVASGALLLGTLFVLIDQHRQTESSRPQPPAVELARLNRIVADAAEAGSIEKLQAVVATGSVTIKDADGEQTIGLNRVVQRQFRKIQGKLEGQYNADVASLERELLDKVFPQWGQIGAAEKDATLAQRQTVLKELETIADRALAVVQKSRQQERPRRYSGFSGPVGVGAEELRVGPDGRPAMPGENPTYLGRSLFTDYMLPVELGGLLLLVAVVGAILIGQRHEHDDDRKELP